MNPLAQNVLYMTGALLHGANLASLTPEQIRQVVDIAKRIVTEIGKQVPSAQ